MRRRSLPGVKLDMTPLIDIVFQLLIFFVLTFRLVEEEGQFEIHLPRTANPTAAAPPQVPPLNVRLVAGVSGGLAEVWLADRRLRGLDELHREVQRLLADPEIASASEANLACDPALAYEHCVAALTALSGTRQPDGSIRPLVANIRFRELP